MRPRVKPGEAALLRSWVRTSWLHLWALRWGGCLGPGNTWGVLTHHWLRGVPTAWLLPLMASAPPFSLGLCQVRSESESRVWLFVSLPGSSIHGIFQARVLSTGVAFHFLLQGIFPTQGLNPGLPHCRQTLYPLSHQGSPRILEWVAYSYLGKEWQWGGEQVSCITSTLVMSLVSCEILKKACLQGRNRLIDIENKLMVTNGGVVR